VHPKGSTLRSSQFHQSGWGLSCPLAGQAVIVIGKINMQQEEIIDFIVSELGKQRRPKDIILALCEKTNMSWADAQKLVLEVRDGHHQEIAARQNTLSTGFSIAFLLLGLPITYIGFWLMSQGIINRVTGLTLFFGGGLLIGGAVGLWNIIVAFFKNK
jgi:hypothetical protein